jgi:hypothetical protein
VSAPAGRESGKKDSISSLLLPEIVRETSLPFFTPPGPMMSDATVRMPPLYNCAWRMFFCASGGIWPAIGDSPTDCISSSPPRQEYRECNQMRGGRMQKWCGNGLVGNQGKWYLVGYCRLRVDYRTFRLDRIQDVAPTSEHCAKRAEFDFRAYAVEHLINYPVKWHIMVVFKAPMDRVRKRIPPSLGTLTETQDGTCLDWPTDDLEYAARYLMARGVPFVVQSPPEFRDALRRLAEETARIAATTS